MSGKRKSGTEKVREKKKLLLLNACDKCFKINDMFSKKSNTTSTSNTLKSATTIESEFDEKTGKFKSFKCIYLFHVL